MDERYRFNRDEISRILRRAAELEHEDNQRDESDGLTLGELQQVSEEVGIDPRYVTRALEELRSASDAAAGTLFGGPFTYRSGFTAEGIVDEETWEDLVAEIRSIHGGIGKTGRLGRSYEWEQRKSDIGYIQISVSPRERFTRVSLQANYRYYASMVYSLSGVFGFLLLNVLFQKLGFSVPAQLLSAGAGTLGLMTAARFYLAGWMKQKRGVYRKLTDRFRELLGGEEARTSDPSREPEAGPSLQMPSGTPGEPGTEGQGRDRERSR